LLDSIQTTETRHERPVAAGRPFRGWRKRLLIGDRSTEKPAPVTETSNGRTIPLPSYKEFNAAYGEIASAVRRAALASQPLEFEETEAVVPFVLETD